MSDVDVTPAPPSTPRPPLQAWLVRYGPRIVGAMRADVKFFADTNFLIQMKKRTGRRNIVGLSWFAPCSAVI